MPAALQADAADGRFRSKERRSAEPKKSPQRMRGPLGAHAISQSEPLSLRPVKLCVLALLTISACSPGQITAEPGCQISATSQPPTPAQLAALGGRYEVTLVNSKGEYGDSLVRGNLLLWANDSARRFMPRTSGRRPGERPLAGRFESHSTTLPSVPNQYEPGSRDNPAVEMVEATIYLGGLEYSDAGGNELEVKEITSGGFRGVWTYSRGFSVTVDSASGRVVREVGGYFCAQRIPKA